MVCQRKWSIVILPTCCLVGFIVCSSLFLKIASVPQNIEKAPIQLLPFGSALAVQLAALACDVVTNTYCTAFLSYKIWQSHRLVRHATPYFRSFSSSNVVAILIESAALYTACIIALFVAFARQSIWNYVITDLCPSIAGIAYCLIIIRFGMGGAFKSHTQLLSSIPSEGRTFQHPCNMAMYPVMVQMEQYTETDGLSAGRGIRASSNAKVEHDGAVSA
ncbi:hypothetical protein PHLGIDRAFT_284279 [Phlebiopsis gigantea 11061_1 CR5-6]|uniref:Uncharacterized protein n=1 Tax=Phlebiopsis gigantea (strain 11061_1 CR5-6) TaxID=745531 RepID=A0A0C3S3Z4_PHLG1|nr:hypothetical protein PHLGIDRAFT_284279 [Phlebiopsis gigantea 11061_1 CR5-6]